MRRLLSSAGQTLAEVGEGWVLNYVISRLVKPKYALLEPGDDAAAFQHHGTAVVSTDMLVAETDVPQGMTWRQIGSKAIVAVVSDLAAKGAGPRYMLINLGLRPDMKTYEFVELWSGLESACSSYGASIIGGDTNECSVPIISVFGIGTAGRLMSRRGARPGDVLATTGLFGKTAAGLRALLNGWVDETPQSLIESVVAPHARLREGLALAATGAVTSCIDSSDGLAASLYQLSAVNDVGFEITSPPIDPEARRFAEEHGLEVLELVLYGGEEYELLFTVGSDGVAEASRALQSVGGTFTPIGTVTRGRGVSLVYEGRRMKVEPRGWQHFRRKRP